MNYSEINEIIKNLLGQLQDLKPQLELARGKEAWVMQEDQDSEIVEEASKEAFNKFLRIIGSAQKNAHRLFDIIPNPLIENILGNLWSLDQPLSAVCFMDNNTGQASLQEGYIEDYINCKKDALTTLRQLSQELSEISPPLVIWQNIISEIRSIGSQSATHKYSKIEGPPGPYNKIREEIAGLLNDIESAQKICIQVSENATTALVKLHHRVSDTKDLVNRNFCKGETPPQKLKSIQDDLSQAFKKIEMEYRDLLEEFAVEFEVAHIKFVKSAEAEQSSTQKPAGSGQENNGENINENIMSLYLELNLAKRTLVVGEITHNITSEKIWAFLKTLAYSRNQHQVTKIQDGDENWKNARDMLRRKIGRKVLRRMVPSSKGCYILDKSVVVKGGGQVGIHRTKSNQHKTGVN